MAEQLTSSDFGISTGLINQSYWENSKWYYVNVERGNAADKLNGRNVNVSFTNNSNDHNNIICFWRRDFEGVKEWADGWAEGEGLGMDG